MKKYFVLDTNVLLHNAEAISSFEDNIVVLPMTVIEELDKFKSGNDELARNARQTIRSLDSLRKRGRLGEGVEMENGGVLRIIMEKDFDFELGMDLGVPDNRILGAAYELHKNGNKVIFVSKDINVRIKADALGLEVMDFEKQTVNFDELFTGHQELIVSGELVDEFFKQEVLTIEDLELAPNEFVLLVDEGNEKHTGLARAGGKNKLIHLDSKIDKVWNVQPRSKEQRMTIELLLDPAVELVTLVGQAGTGKTLLALAAGLETVVRKKQYDKLLVSRPVIPLGRDIGYLPGSKDEKISFWMQPIFDNLTYLMADGASKGR